MRLGAVMMVRNEADIIEVSLRHNLRVVDHLLVIDHASDDGTPAIVAALAREGLPVTLMRDESVGFHQSRRSTEGARWLFGQQSIDRVFALDADELLKVPSRGALESGLAQARDLHVRVRMQTYVADDYGDRAPFTPARFRRRLAAEANPQMKIAVHRDFLSRESEVITIGNHLVVDTARPGELPNYPGIAAGVVAIAHFPIRSAPQVTNKAILGWLAHSATHPAGDAAFHWRELYEDLRRGATVDAPRLLELAVNYGIPRAQWRRPQDVALVEDPLADPPAAVHGNMAMMEPLPLLMAYAERLIRATAPQTKPRS